MRINYTMFGTDFTGGVRVLFEIVNGLIKKGHEVTITSMRNGYGHKWFPLKAKVNYISNSFIKKVMNYVNYRMKKVFDMESILPLEDLAKSIPECEINVATFCFTAFSVFRSGKGIPFYHMQHYEPLLFDDHYLKKMVEEVYYLPLNKIVNSVWLKDQMREKYSYDLPIINPAIDHNVFYPREVKRTWSKMRILCFGKQARWKGFPEALESMELVMKKRKGIEFVVFGVNRPSYESVVPYKFVKYPSDDELAELYSSADVMICPSWYESFPLFPLEAMACGAPVVTTRYGTEDYAFHEKNCSVVPPKDPKALAEATLRLLDDKNLRERFREEAIKTARKFTWDKTVDKVEKLFERALK